MCDYPSVQTTVACPARPPAPSAEVALPHANGPFTVLCTTRDARAETRFTLSVFANEPVRIRDLSTLKLWTRGFYL